MNEEFKKKLLQFKYIILIRFVDIVEWKQKTFLNDKNNIFYTQQHWPSSVHPFVTQKKSYQN
jgi:hypothetical protein